MIRLTAATSSAVRQARAITRICIMAACCWTIAAVVICVVGAIVLPLVLVPVLAAVVGVLWVTPLIRLSLIRPPLSPTVQPPHGGYSELMLAVRQVTAALGVPEPAGVEISPDCDAWLEPRPDGPVLVIGAPFLWWLRVSELRGLLAPVLAGIEAAHDRQLRTARRFIRRLDIAESHGCPPWPRSSIGVVARACRLRAERMERAVGASAAEHARAVEPTARVYAHEQAGLVAVGWDRLLHRLALPAWRAGRAPENLNAALAAALTELGQRDRVGVGLADRLTERPACDLLDEPGQLDREVSAIAPAMYQAGLQGTPLRADPKTYRPLPWTHYVAEVAEPALRADAAAAPDHPLISKVRAMLDQPPAGTPAPGELASGLRAVVQCGLVDKDLATPEVDWLDGVVLRDRAGLVVPVDELVHALLDNADFDPLRAWVSYAAGLNGGDAAVVGSRHA
ncbi:MAG TPA: hypothetical protein VGM10_19450 [Actinocrinis sp.]